MELQNTEITFSEKSLEKEQKVELIAVPVSGAVIEEAPPQDHRINGTHLISQPVVHFQKIPLDLVDLMVKEIENEPVLEFSNAQTGTAINPNSDIQIRNSKVNWWYEDHWVSSIISHYINIANRSSWEYDLTFLNGLQVTNYDAGGHYVWHSDYGTSNDARYTRKLSASLLVTDPSEYEGGELEFVDYHNNMLRAPKEKGTLIVFDSRVPHRVTPVLRGRRTSIVAWMLGPKLR
jgi:hypothetical protein